MMLAATGFFRCPYCTVTAAGCTPMLSDFPMLASERLGSFHGFQHRIELKLDTVHVTCLTRPIPFALREKVEAVVWELDQQGIWDYGFLSSE